MGGSNFSATLRDGSPGATRVLPVGWRDLASQPSTTATAHGNLYFNYALGYGYQWWSFPAGANAIAQGLTMHDGAFTAQGVYGQYLYINPKEDAVAVVWSLRRCAKYDVLGVGRCQSHFLQ